MGTLAAEHEFACNTGSDWSYTLHLENGSVEISIPQDLSGLADVQDLVSYLNVDGKIPDERAQWHRNYTPIEPWFRAHVYRCILDESLNSFQERLQNNPQTAIQFRLREDITEQRPPFSVDDTAKQPSYSQLYDIWHDTFSTRTRGACYIIAQRLVERARDESIPAPEDVFRPDDDVEVEKVDTNNPTVRELTIEKTGDIWEHVRPMVLNHWELKRHHNWQVPDSTFFDAHACLAISGENAFPESGVGNMKAKSRYDRVHYPSTHRRELKRFELDEIRELHRSVTEDLIREARREGEFDGGLTVAIDSTKGKPFTGEIERSEDGKNVEQWILGYKNDNDQRPQYYFQWATIQVVGLDIPLVLNAVPIHRGYAREDIVDDLLETSTDIVDIELVLMDGDFDSDGVKNVCEKHDTYYLNRKSRDKDDKRRMRKMWANDESFHIDEGHARPGMPVRKTFYVPKFAVDDEDNEKDEPEDNLRQELIDDFQDVGGTELPRESPFESLLDEMREEEGRDDGDIDGSEMYVAFETNHPLANKRPAARRVEYHESEQRHGVARMMRRYGNRWGIENGYKKLGEFFPRTASRDPVLRFFGFMFAATLYNCWRLVDLLVKLSVEDEPEYTPLVPASRFMAVAEGMFGLDNPPP